MKSMTFNILCAGRGENHWVFRQRLVRDIIKKSEDELIYLEEKLGLYKKFRSIKSNADELISIIESSEISPELKNKIRDFAESVRLSI